MVGFRAGRIPTPAIAALCELHPDLVVDVKRLKWDDQELIPLSIWWISRMSAKPVRSGRDTIEADDREPQAIEQLGAGECTCHPLRNVFPTGARCTRPTHDRIRCGRQLGMRYRIGDV